MRKMLRQNFPYRLQFYLHLTLAYSCHYIKQRKNKRIFWLRMKQNSSNLLVVKIYSMAALGICVLVCVLTEQFPIFKFQSHLAIYNQCFYSAQESMSFIIVHIVDFEHVMPAVSIQKFSFSFQKNTCVPWSQRN